jgi:hypothetical protein
MKPHSIPLAATSSAPRALLAALVVTGCAGAPTPPVLHVAEPVEAPPAPPTPTLAARWVESGGATLVGPTVGDATLVLLGGRRALVGPDGALRNEAVPCPEPLLELIEVPAAESGAPSRLVGRGAHGVYRFDDPLGAPVALARAGADLAHLGALPGLVAVWTTRSDLPRFLDVSTGRPRELGGLPKLPLRAVLFTDARRGAAIFEAVGLVTSADGGASWKLAEAAARGDALRMNGLRRRGDALRAFTYAEGPEAAVDADAAKLAAIEPPALPARGAPPLLRWIQATGRDPLEAAASGGIDLGARGALVASHGLLARVDLKTGAILELVEFAHGKWMTACSAAAAAGGGALIACALSEDQGGADLFDPFGVLRVTTSDPLHVDRPIVIRNGDVELRASPSGGAMLLGSCAPSGDGEVCVRQSDGKWLPRRPEIELGNRGAGALADGRIAFLRGLTDADVAPDAEPDPRAPKGDDEAAPPSRRLHLATLDAAGHERAYGSITLPEGKELGRVESPIEEDDDHTLHLVLEAGEELFAVSQVQGKEAASVQPLARVSAARIHAGRGLAVGEERVLASPDGGATWSEVPVAERVLAAFRDGSPSEPGALAVSAVGARIGTDLRLGWGPPEAAPPPSTALDAPLLDAPAAPEASGDRPLTCATSGASTGLAPLLGATQIKALFGSKAPPRGARRETHAWSSGRAAMLDTTALLEEDGDSARGSAPKSWTLRWFDPTEIGGKTRSLTRPSEGADATAPPWGASLRFAAASGARALFALHVGGRYLLVRTKPGGGSETAAISPDLVPLGEAVFSADKGDTIAWMHESDLIVWIAGEPPRSIAQVAAHAGRWLGQPTRDGVPLLLGGPDWAIARALPIPPLDKLRVARPAPPTLDGWTRAVNLRGDVGTFPACGAAPAGASYQVQRSFVAVRVDGVEHRSSTALYDVRVDLVGKRPAACVAGLSALVTPTRSATAAKSAKPAAKGEGAVAFVRVDLAGKRAEGGDRGAPPAKVRRLACALEPAAPKP